MTKYSFDKGSLVHLLTAFSFILPNPILPPGTTSLFPVSVNLAFCVFLLLFVKDSTDMGDHMESGLSLTYFALHSASQSVPVVTMARFHFLIWLGSIPAGIRITCPSSVYQWTLRLHLRLRLCVGCCKQCFSELRFVCVYIYPFKLVFQFP